MAVEREYPRDWPRYNEELVMRGTFYVAADFVEDQEEELARMNEGKSGSPYQYGELQMRFEGVLHQYLDYRSIEGFMRELLKCIPGLKADNYTSICRRFNKLGLSIDLPKSLEGCEVIADATGVKVSNRGEWIRQKWKVRRGWIKVSVSIDRETKSLLDIEVADESMGDGELAEKHLDKFEKGEIKSFYMDGAGYRETIFDKLKKLNAQPVISIPKNASVKRLDPMHTAAREFTKLGYNAWRDKCQYGDRWHVEGFFSAQKRKFGEIVRATKKENILHEAAMKFVLLDRLRKRATALV